LPTAGEIVLFDRSWYNRAVVERVMGFRTTGEYLKYVGYPLGTSHSSVADFEFTVREFDRLTPEAVQGNAMSLDLEKFRRSGGKLIIWHGWDDQAIPATGRLDYCQRLWQHSGGLRDTQDWARMFMIPTMAHCLGGYQLTEFDPFRELVSWVEHGTPPDRIIATARDAQNTVLRSRPVFPYPVRPTTAPAASTTQATSFPLSRYSRRTTPSTGSAQTCMPSLDQWRPSPAINADWRERPPGCRRGRHPDTPPER
jgi:hypothetical protein